MDHTPNTPLLRQEEVEAAGLVGLWWLWCRGIGAACDLGSKLQKVVSQVYPWQSRAMFGNPIFANVWHIFKLQSCICWLLFAMCFYMVLIRSILQYPGFFPSWAGGHWWHLRSESFKCLDMPPQVPSGVYQMNFRHHWENGEWLRKILTIGTTACTVYCKDL